MLQNNIIVILSLLIGFSNTLQTENSNIKTSSSDSSSEDVNPIIECIAGVIIFLFSFPVLWYNEFKAAQNEINLAKAKKYCISIDNEYLDERYQGQLVHTSGKASTNDIIYSKKFGIQLSYCIALYREVETYQWVRHEETKGTGKNKKKIITFRQEWKSVPQETNDGNHLNHDYFWTVKHKKKFAKAVNVGMYELSKSLKLQALQKELITPQEQWISFAGSGYPDRRQQNIVIDGDFLYLTQYHGVSTVGDQRIKFYQVPCGEITVVSQLKGNTFEPFSLNVQAELLLDDHEERKRHSTIYVPQDFMAIIGNEQLGVNETINRLLEPIKYIDWLLEWKLSKDEIFNFKLKESRRLAWFVRLSGFLLMATGIMLMFQPVVWIISWFPLFGNFLGELSAFLFLCVGVLMAIPLSLLTISIAWLRFHPFKALILLCFGGCVGAIIWVIVASSD